MASDDGPTHDDDAPLLFRGRDDDAALAVSRGRIVATGAPALTRAGLGWRRVDVGDGVMVAAFRDGHLHPITGGLQQLGAPIAAAATLEDLLARVAEHARAHPELPWVTGAGYDPALLPEGLGQAVRLDEVVPGRPVLLWAADRHSAWANTAALRRAGITSSRGDPRAGRVVRAADGTPTGALLEEAANQVAAYAPRPTGTMKESALKAAQQEMVSCGLVWGLDAAATPADVAVYARLAAREELPCRMALALIADPDCWQSQRADFAALRAQAPPEPGADLCVSSVKFFADGIVEAGTAALVDPYHDDPCSYGIPIWAPEELAHAVAAFDTGRFGIHIHAIGDAAVRAALDAIEYTITVNGPRDRRPVIAHAQVVQPSDLDRFAALGVIANFQPLWAQRDRVMTELTEPLAGADPHGVAISHRRPRPARRPPQFRQ